jgi:hypothetical protein
MMVPAAFFFVSGGKPPTVIRAKNKKKNYGVECKMDNRF